LLLCLILKLFTLHFNGCPRLALLDEFSLQSSYLFITERMNLLGSFLGILKHICLLPQSLLQTLFLSPRHEKFLFKSLNLGGLHLEGCGSFLFRP
jgi:hypothetical protein